MERPEVLEPTIFVRTAREWSSDRQCRFGERIHCVALSLGFRAFLSVAGSKMAAPLLINEFSICRSVCTRRQRCCARQICITVYQLQLNIVSLEFAVLL